MADVTLYQGEASPNDVRLRAAASGGAQSVSTTPATMTLLPVLASSLLETAAGVVSLNLSVVAATAFLTLSVASTPATMTLTPVAATASPGVLALSSTPATLTLSPAAATASPGPWQVSSTPATMTLSPVAATALLGPWQVNAGVVGLTFTVVTASPAPGTIYKDADVILLTLSPVAATASPGPWQVSTTGLAIQLVPVAALGSPGPYAASSTPATMALVPIAAFGGNVSYGTTPVLFGLALARANAKLSVQQRQEPVSEYSINYQARTYATFGLVARGDVLSRDAAGYYITSTSAARTAGYPAVAVALNPNDASGVTTIKEVGDLDASITGLGAGQAWPVIVNAAGRLERKQTPSGSDYVVGQADPAGNVLLVWPAPKVL